MTSTGRLARSFALVWPAACVAGLLLIAFAQVKWGISDEGVQPSITGLGRVSVPGASADDVAYFFDGQTRRPGLWVVIAGAVVAVAALAGWLRRQFRWPAAVIVVVAALVSLVTAVWTISDPAARLFSERLTEALDLDLPTMQPGYGVIGTAVVAVVLVGLMVFWVAVGRRADSSDPISRTDESS